MRLDDKTGVIDIAEYVASPNYDEREDHIEPSVIVIHCISLPPGEYGGSGVIDFFTNKLDENSHPYFKEIKHLTVSAHFFIRRDGRLIQFVPTRQRAWHAGESYCLGKPKVNDFSVGIELEGLDTATDGFTELQYKTLIELIACLQAVYPAIKTNNIFAHSDIAIGRKTDPGACFDWQRIYV